MGCCSSMCCVYYNRCKYDLCWASCCVSEEELVQRQKIMRLFHQINQFTLCPFFKSEYKDGVQRPNNVLPDDLQPCWSRCCTCMYPFEEEINDTEIQVFRDYVCDPEERKKMPNLNDATAGLFCDLVLGYTQVHITQQNLKNQVIAKDKGLYEADGVTPRFGGPEYPGLPRFPEGHRNPGNNTLDAGQVDLKKIGLIGALTTTDNVEFNLCGAPKQVVSKSEFYKIFMQATIVIQCRLFNDLEEAFLRQSNLKHSRNATMGKI